MSCVIKYDHDDGVKLRESEYVLWCGRKHYGLEFLFQNAQHAALANLPICQSCRKKIKEALYK